MLKKKKTRFLVLLVIAILSTGQAGAEVVVLDGPAPPELEAAWPADAGTGSRLVGKLDHPGYVLFVPFFLVGKGGLSTLFAVRNTTNEPVPITVDYFHLYVLDGALRTDHLELAPYAVLTVNLATLPQLQPSGPDPSFGFVRIRNAAGDVDVLTGDYFLIDTANNFATGDRLLNFTEFCNAVSIRFLVGGGFDGGTRLRLLVENPQGAEPALDPPTAEVRIWDEAGNEVGFRRLYTDDNLIELAAEQLTEYPFGAMVIDFRRTRGAVFADYSAFGKFSVGMNGSCLIE